MKPRIILILLLIAAGIFLLYKEFGREEIPKKIPEKKPVILPKVAIVMDDLGPSKKIAETVFSINAPITLSILPHEAYTAWIAAEGHRLGYDIIAHIPMESKKFHALGKGGLYTWMTDSEIAETLDSALRSLPHVIGVSNHIGSAFTEDERAMHVVAAELRDRGLFFLDSLTTPKSVGMKIARTYGIKALQRDVFLDNEDSPEYIQRQWEEAVKIAKKKGYAIILAHPRKNTVEFLERALSKNEVTVVHLSGLVASP